MFNASALSIQEHVTVRKQVIGRRRFLRDLTALGAVGGVLGFRDAVSLHAEELRKQGRSLILLWMNGGPSQLETFDPKPGHENGGETKAISTSVPGIRIAEGWEETAKVAKHIAFIRSLTNKEGNHQRATYQLHTGYIPSGSVQHPSFGSCVAQQLADPASELPSVVSIGPTTGAGFLGVEYEPFLVNQPGEVPQNLESTASQSRFERRLALRSRLDQEFASRGAGTVVVNQRQLYQKASRLVLSPRTNTFSLDDESAELRQQYGETNFGRGCLLARRLVEAGVPFVEVRSNGWDTHDDNFSRVAEKAAEVDPASATLVRDLHERGMLDRTVVLWAGEFGRTPRVNPRSGRDHYPRAFNGWLAGGGIRGGQVIGSTSKDGTAVEDRPVSVPDLLQSLCRALAIDSTLENISPLGRPMKVVDGGEPVAELFS